MQRCGLRGRIGSHSRTAIDFSLSLYPETGRLRAHCDNALTGYFATRSATPCCLSTRRQVSPLCIRTFTIRVPLFSQVNSHERYQAHKCLFFNDCAVQSWVLKLQSEIQAYHGCCRFVGKGELTAQPWRNSHASVREPYLHHQTCIWQQL